MSQGASHIRGPCGGRRVTDRAVRAERPLICAVSLLLSGCIYLSRHTPPGACANDLGSPMRNFCVVTPGVFWRGASPDRADAAWLVQHGVGTVVSLSRDLHHPFESARVDPRLVRSVTYYQVRDFPATDLLTHYRLDDHVAHVLAIIMRAPKPVFVTCRAGVDRTGIIAATYRVIIEGRSRGGAIAEMDRFHSPWDPLNARYVRSLSMARQPEVLRDMTKWEARIKPSGDFECRNGNCRFHNAATPRYSAQRTSIPSGALNVARSLERPPRRSSPERLFGQGTPGLRPFQ
jgi:rhodanese/phosphatase family protein